MHRLPPSSSAEVDVIPSEDLVQRFWDRTANGRGALDQVEFDDPESDASKPGSLSGGEFASLPRARTNVEAVMGLCAAFTIGLPVPLVVTIAVMNLRLPNQAVLVALATATFLASGYLCLTVLRLGSRAVEGDHSANSFYLMPESSVKRLDHTPNDGFYIPLALAMAIRLPDWWTLIRPFIAFWWLGHFVIAALFGHMAAKQFIGVNNPGLLPVLATIAVTMSFLFAANLYLMLALAVSIPLPRIWLLVWRYRFVVDLVVTAAMIANT